MFKAFIHFARQTENALEKRLGYIQESAARLNADAEEHLEFLIDTQIELTNRMGRVRQVIESAEKLTNHNA